MYTYVYTYLYICMDMRIDFGSNMVLLELKLELLGAKMAAKSAKMGQHDRQDGHFGINLAAFGSIGGAFWSHLGKQAKY